MVSNVRKENQVKNVATIKKKQKTKKAKKGNVNESIETNESLQTLKTPVQLENGNEKTEQTEDVPMEELSNKYPVLNDEELIKKFLNVPLNNNQKGRLRQLLRDQLKDTSNVLLPDVINSKIQSIIKESKDLNESELRKVRILYNMLKTAVQTEKPTEKKKKDKKSKKNKKNKENNTDINAEAQNNESTNDAEDNEEIVDKKKAKKEKNEKDKDKDDQVNKIKGPKRYVVFVGNLPVGIETETIMNHFKELSDHIVSVRIPTQKEGSKSAIAYLELKNEHSYELALSKHHSMLGNKRINVLYTTQKNSKVSKTEAKSKSAKLIALQKSGKLAGSISLSKKRSQRRAKAKRFQAKREAASQ